MRPLPQCDRQNLVERAVDFYRARHTRCAACGHEETLDLDWFERWSVGDEFCPGCRVDCTEEKATRVVADPQDPALDDALVARLSWWHTSSFPDWPSASFDPVARLTEVTRRRMGSQGVRRWAERQRKKALHVGTYEAAIHNLLRRISDQPEPETRYNLYRVKLRPDVIVAPGAGDELVDWMGDVPLSRACPPGIDAARYVNQHEDVGGISLALGRTALLAVQRIELPAVPSPQPGWWSAAVTELRRAAAVPHSDASDDPSPRRWRRRVRTPSPVAKAQQEVCESLTAHLPVNLRDRAQRHYSGQRSAAGSDCAGFTDPDVPSSLHLGSGLGDVMAGSSSFTSTVLLRLGRCIQCLRRSLSWPGLSMSSTRTRISRARLISRPLSSSIAFTSLLAPHLAWSRYAPPKRAGGSSQEVAWSQVSRWKRPSAENLRRKQAHDLSTPRTSSSVTWPRADLLIPTCRMRRTRWRGGVTPL